MGWSGFLMWHHHLTKYELQKYYQNKPKVNGDYSRNNLPEIKNGVYVINLDKYKSIGIHWMEFYVNRDNVTDFESFGVKYIPNKTKKIHRK